MKRSFPLLWLILMCSLSLYAQPKKYEAVVDVKLFGVHTGTVTLDLNGANKDVITISTTNRDKTKTKKSVDVTKTKSAQSFNMALVNNIRIDGVDYQVMSGEMDYKKSLKNILVRNVLGNNSFGIYQQGDTDSLQRLFIKLPHGTSNLVHIEHEYYTKNGVWQILAFNSCGGLAKKIKNKDDGFVLSEKMPIKDRYAVWKKYLDEYDLCSEYK